MYYNKFKDEELSGLGFGCMRLPTIDGKEENPDPVASAEMVDYAMAHGVNYYDTAWGYHYEKSESVLGEALSKYDHKDFNIASKFPGYDLSYFGKHEEIFEKQLEKCKVDYFDFYLFHNVCETNIDAYVNDEFGLREYLIEQKKNGHIRHLGFSCHGTYDTMMRFLEKNGDIVEFCQIQLNYLDYEFQNAKLKVEELNKRGIPIWVMEGLRGGKLAGSCLGAEEELAKFRPDFTPVNWAFSYLESVPGVTMILSGMSSLEQMKQNIEFFEEKKTLSDEEISILMDAAHKDIQAREGTVPCTACRYCMSKCPMELEIPRLLELYNEHVYTGGGFIAPMALASFDDSKKPSACIGCGSCKAVCPQSIDIPGTMTKFTELLANNPF
ncbi:MAG: aldo/keto reductase [Mogibacterium sp.]|nr:aldo/keto reductase [Mogibacterium sp.]